MDWVDIWCKRRRQQVVNQRNSLLLAGAITLIVGMAACAMAPPPSLELRYRVTVTASVDGTTVTGSSVINSEYTFTYVLNSIGITEVWSGEAVTVELRPGEYLFALHKLPPGPVSWGITVVSAACGLAPLAEIDRGDAAVWLAALDAKFQDSCELHRNYWPPMALTTNPDDPEALQVVTADQLPAGVSISKITLERTDEPVTFGPVNVLSWLDGNDGPKKKFKLEQDGHTGYLRPGRYEFTSKTLGP